MSDLTPSSIPAETLRPFQGILAMDEGRVIGKGGYLPWKIKEDLRWFRKITTGNTIVMGRTTWEGILAENGPDFTFPKRHVVVLTRSGHTWPVAQTVAGLPELLRLTLSPATNEALPGKVIIGGGAQIFVAAMPYIEKMYVTQVKGLHEGDTYMPEFESAFPYRTISEEHPACTMLTLSRTPLSSP